MKKEEVILAIETSCDETAVSILKDGKEVLADSLNTQIEEHQKFGGVYPELASRLHLENITSVLSYVLSLKGFDYRRITHVAVTSGPGLPGALQIGAMSAKTIASYLGVPLVEVHHLAGHIYSSEMVSDFKYPLLAVVVSGGNTEIVLLEKPFSFRILGQTLDDALGEALDKVGRELGLPYPGGVSIDRITSSHDAELIPLPKPKVDGYNVSYSGLKSHLVRLIKKEREDGTLTPEKIKAIAYSAEKNFVDQLLDRVEICKNDFSCSMIVLGGGVSANSYLRKEITRRFSSSMEVLIPPMRCTTDNALMIAKAAHHLIEMGRLSPKSFVTKPSWNLDDFSKGM